MTRTRTYLDQNATAPLRPEARAAMLAALDLVGNASSVHAEGRKARAVVELARADVAALVGAKPEQVVFTASATEANNWALRAGWSEVVVSAIEHESVLAAARAASARIHEIAADGTGIANVDDIAALIGASANTRTKALVSLQLANSETGVLQPVARAVALARECGFAIHTDAVQAAGRISVDFEAIGVDLMSISAHKLGGPKGVGALVVRDGLDLASFVVGGGQERRRRAGTENVAAIAGFGAAANAAAAELRAGPARLAALRDRLEAGVRRRTPDAVVIGSDAQRLPNTSAIALPGAEATTLLIKLDLAGIAVSAGSACSSGKVGGSHVLAAMDLAPDLARAAIRISLGWSSTGADVDRFLDVWGAITANRNIRGPASAAAASIGAGSRRLAVHAGE